MSGLVPLDWLEGRLGDPGVVLLEVSFYPPDKAAWFRGHIPGSRYVYWKDLCWHDSDRQFPEPGVMAQRLGRLGAGDDSTVVLIGDTIQFATYAYWVMSMTGLEERAVVLDGGHRTWEEQGRPMTMDEPRPAQPRSLPVGVSDHSSRVGRNDVLAGLSDAGRTLVDLRSGEEYRGERVAPLTAPFDHGAERGGHIPGARHLHHERLLRQDGTFRPPDEIEAEFAAVDAGPGQQVVTYCRLSHRASLGWFALTRLGERDDVKVYDGSWTEWGSMVGMPVEQ
ncbi:MAG: sulfurtransferase [Acidimicrobiia bacterium]|nr:sulfurtransferase [Acidimicrobiia bacterium]